MFESFFYYFICSIVCDIYMCVDALLIHHHHHFVTALMWTSMLKSQNSKIRSFYYYYYFIKVLNRKICRVASKSIESWISYYTILFSNRSLGFLDFLPDSIDQTNDVSNTGRIFVCFNLWLAQEMGFESAAAIPQTKKIEFCRIRLTQWP